MRTRNMLATLLLAAHPVGSYYWSSEATDPGELFGGTWERIKDKFVLAAGDSYAAGATGGASSGSTGAVAPSTNAVSLTTNNASPGTNSVANHTHGSGTYTSKISLWGDILCVSTRQLKPVWTVEDKRTLSYYSGSDAPSTDWGAVVYGDSGSAGGHSHTVNAHSHTVNAHSHTVNSHAHTVETMPPYITAYCWRRTA